MAAESVLKRIRPDSIVFIFVLALNNRATKAPGFGSDLGAVC